MNDATSMLTLTGVIATLLSVVFAVAAFLVQRKGKQQSSKKEAKNNATKQVLDAHQVPHLPSPEQILSQQEQALSGGQPDDEAAIPTPVMTPAGKAAKNKPPAESGHRTEQTDDPPQPAQPTSSFFKKYSPSGEDEDMSQPDEADELYLWD